jgi:hypothetical protein
MMLRLDGMEDWIDGICPLSVPWLPSYIEEYKNRGSEARIGETRALKLE